MKILENYKKIAQELLLEVDDEKMIRYKDKDGESKEMKAGSAKTMPTDHPAKQQWDKMQDSGDGSDDKEAPSDKKIGKGDFDRDSGDKPKGDSSTASEKNELEAKYDIKIPNGPLDKEDTEDESALDIADAIAKKYDISAEYAMERAKEEIGNSESYIEFAKTMENDIEEMAEEGGAQPYDEPMFDDDGMRKLRNKDSDDDDHGAMEKEYNVKIPGGTMEPDENDEDDDAKEIANALAKKYDISREYAIERANEETDSSNTYLEFAKNLEFEFQEMANEGGHQKYDEPMFDDDGMRKLRHQEESVKPKKKPFLKEQLERFGGGKY